MMSNEIIDYYKTANETKSAIVSGDNKEQHIVENVKVSDPFEKFLVELTEKLKTVPSDKNEKLEIIKEVVEDEKTIETSSNPFSNFLSDFSKILDKEKNKKEEKVKDSAIDFIQNLKNNISSTPKKVEKTLPKKIKNKIKIVDKRPVIKQEDEETKVVNDNKYVDQLKNIDKSTPVPEKVKTKTDIRTIIAKQVKEELDKFKVQFSKIALESGGSGSVAVQFAKGGTMNGDLNVIGKYLSGGIDLSQILGGGQSEADRLISGSQSLILNPDGSISFPNNFIASPDGEVLNIESETNIDTLSGFTRISLSPYGFFAYDSNSNSITFDSIDNEIVLTSQDEHEWTFNKEGVLVGPGNKLTVTSLSSLGKILSGDRDLADIFLTTETDSQTLSWNASSYELSISNGNTISLSSLSAQPVVTFTYRFDYIPNTSYSGKAITGSLESDNAWTINRTTFTTTGTVSATEKAINVAWIDRLSVTYI